MLTPSLFAVVLWLHLLAASVWIGGQIVLAAVVPLLREDRNTLRLVARRYQVIAWPAFGVLITTGVLNILHIASGRPDFWSSSTAHTLVFKLVLVALSGGAAAIHAVVQAPRSERTGSSPLASAILGSTSLLAALGAALYGVVIAGA